MEHLLHIDFVPHKVCWLNRADIIATHALGDGLITVAYYLIPIMLFYLSRTYQLDWRVRFIFFVYGTFIFLCGTTHLLDVVMIWYISENLIQWDGILRMITGVFSMFSAGTTLYLVFKFWELSGKVLGLLSKMRADRKAQGRMADETWNELQELTDRATNMLRSKRESQEA